LSNKIIQSDNAVIDYTTISALINTVNQQQDQIESLQKATTHTDTTYDINGLQIKSIGTMSFQSGRKLIENNHVTINYSFSKPPTVVGTVLSLSSKGNKAYAYIDKMPTASEASFTVISSSPSGTKGMYLYWVAIASNS
jgi:hypothetical protein